MKKLFIGFTLLTLSAASFCADGTLKKTKRDVSLINASADVDLKKERLVGNILKNALETYHYRKIEINDDISKKAFEQYLKKVDYGKQFLLKNDIKKLESFRYKMDDQMVSADHKLLNKTTDILAKRIKQIEGFRSEIFSKKFDFNKSEKIELDPEKRQFSRNEKQLKEHWRKVFKQSTLTRYLSLVDDQKDDAKNKKDKKAKKVKKSKKDKKTAKKLSKKELRKKAHDAIAKKYKRFFTRLMKDDRVDYLEKFFNSIATIYDPHTVYLPPKRKEDFDIDISGSLEGIGAVLQEDGQYIKVVKIVPGGAAWRQKGLEVNDVILMVSQGSGEAVDLVDMRVDDAVRYIRGKKGTEVRLTVKKADGTRKVVPIIRDVVQIGASFAKSSVLNFKDSNKKIGYIHVPKFYRDFGSKSDTNNCTADVKMELKNLKKQKVDAVILDLRNNGGGALEDARQMSGLFIPKGPIVQIKNHTGKIDVLEDNDTSVTYGGPLIVMVNRFSASASEILAAAMQDYGRAIIVGGEYSHGKGTVQAVVNLNQGPLLSMFGGGMGALKVTIQKFYRVTGASTQYKGVTPDIIIPDPFGYTENREQDLDYSLPWDQVPAKGFVPWKDIDYKLSTLKSRSGKRVVKDKRFKKIRKYVDYLVKKKKDTSVSLKMDDVIAEEINSKKMTEELKLDDENKNLMVTHFEKSLLAHEKVTKGDEKKWKEDFKQRKEEWVKGLRQDAGLEEAMNIINDILDMTSGKKLTQVK